MSFVFSEFQEALIEALRERPYAHCESKQQADVDERRREAAEGWVTTNNHARLVELVTMAVLDTFFPVSDVNGNPYYDAPDTIEEYTIDDTIDDSNF